MSSQLLNIVVQRPIFCCRKNKLYCENNFNDWVQETLNYQIWSLAVLPHFVSRKHNEVVPKLPLNVRLSLHVISTFCFWPGCFCSQSKHRPHKSHCLKHKRVSVLTCSTCSGAGAFHSANCASSWPHCDPEMNWGLTLLRMFQSVTCVSEEVRRDERKDWMERGTSVAHRSFLLLFYFYFFSQTIWVWLD